MQKIARRRLVQAVARELLAGADSNQLTTQVAAYLIKHRMTKQADRLVEDLAALLQQAAGHATATVTTAAAHPPQQELDTIRRTIQHLIGAREVELSLQQDPSLLGGVVVTLPGYQLDASLRRKLNMLATGGVTHG